MGMAGTGHWERETDNMPEMKARVAEPQASISPALHKLIFSQSTADRTSAIVLLPAAGRTVSREGQSSFSS